MLWLVNEFILQEVMVDLFLMSRLTSYYHMAMRMTWKLLFPTCHGVVNASLCLQLQGQITLSFSGPCAYYLILFQTASQL